MILTNRRKSYTLGFRRHVPTEILKELEGAPIIIVPPLISTFQSIEVIPWQVAPQQSLPPLDFDEN